MVIKRDNRRLYIITFFILHVWSIKYLKWNFMGRWYDFIQQILESLLGFLTLCEKYASEPVTTRRERVLQKKKRFWGVLQYLCALHGLTFGWTCWGVSSWEVCQVCCRKHFPLVNNPSHFLIMTPNCFGNGVTALPQIYGQQQQRL